VARAEDISRLEKLIPEAKQCLAAFRKIFRDHPLSEVSIRPTSMRWRPAAGAAISDQAVQDGVSAHQALRKHLEGVKRYFVDWRDSPKKWESLPLKYYLLPYWTPGMQNESQHSWLLALEDHCELLGIELSKLVKPSGNAALRGTVVPEDFPRRLEAAKGRLSWAQFAEKLGLDPKTLGKLRAPNSRVDQRSCNRALEFLSKAETQKSGIPSTASPNQSHRPG
jgi:hypothetical protein